MRGRVALTARPVARSSLAADAVTYLGVCGTVEQYVQVKQAHDADIKLKKFQECHANVTSYEAANPAILEYTNASEKDAKLAQELGQLQPFLAAFPLQCTGQLASSGPT